MANIYAWDGSKMLKVVLFPMIYKKISPMIKGSGWYAAKLKEVSDKKEYSRVDSFTLDNENSLITIESYISRKNLVKA
jgi:hypothetical protein